MGGNNERIEFQGEYKDGKRWNGTIQKYNWGKLTFEGNYKTGRENGNGKEYYENGKILFEGEYINGKKWNGIGYNINGNKEYEIKDGKGNIKKYCYYDGKL